MPEKLKIIKANMKIRSPKILKGGGFIINSPVSVSNHRQYLQKISVVKFCRNVAKIVQVIGPAMRKMRTIGGLLPLPGPPVTI